MGLIKADKELTVKLFIRDLENNDETVLASAISHLSYTKSKEPYNKIVMLSNNPSPEVRIWCADYLGNFDNNSSVRVLKEMLNDPNKDVRQSADINLNILMNSK